jgi:regulator of RNase E activity RraA
MSFLSGIEIHPHPQTPAATVQALSGFATSIVSDIMGGRLIGSSDLRPVHRSVLMACGQAVTVRVRGGDNLMIHKALSTLQPGDVLVVDGDADTGRALVGEIMMSYAKSKGAVAFVIDGAIRDADSYETKQFPCWSRGINLRGPYKDGPGSINVPVVVGGMRVNPGDIVLCDGDGVVAVPPEMAMEVAQKAQEKVDAERATLAAIAAGTYSAPWVDEALKAKGL